MSRAAALAVAALALLGAGVRPPGLADVTAVKVWDHETYTRVVVELSAKARYQLYRIGSPARLYVDIDGTWIEAPHRAPLESARGTPLLRVRGGQNTLHTARVVLDLDSPDRGHRVFSLDNPFRIVMDVFTASRPAVPPPRVTFDERPVRRVVLDPGHGGKDPGATRGRLREKDLVLRIARHAKEALEREGLKVFLTRDRDRYLTLEERTRRANEWNGDLFVSIHANASPNAKTEGIETYLLDTRYDRQTARVAARENGMTVDQLEADDLPVILASLRLGYSERYAARLAREVHTGLREQLRGQHRATRDLGVKRGPFLVLFQADMPAVLVEVGFLSSRSEAKRMKGAAFARAAGRGIAEGILGYRKEHARSLVAER